MYITHTQYVRFPNLNPLKTDSPTNGEETVDDVMQKIASMTGQHYQRILLSSKPSCVVNGYRLSNGAFVSQVPPYHLDEAK